MDVGTHGTRAAVESMEKRGRFAGNSTDEPLIVHRDNVFKDEVGFDLCSYPAGMKPFDITKPPEQCINFSNDSSALFPVKMFIYVLWVREIRKRNHAGDAKAVAKIIDLIPQLEAFFVRFDQCCRSKQDIIIAHALDTYLAHLRQVKSDSESQALKMNVRVTELGASIPPNWDNWMQRVFIQILEKVWTSIERDSIELIAESHAAFNWLMHLTYEMRKVRPTQLIHADFGGHTFVGHPLQV